MKGGQCKGATIPILVLLLLSNNDVSGNQPLLVVIYHDKCMKLHKSRNLFTSFELDPL